jgi:hypothetical protein
MNGMSNDLLAIFFVKKYIFFVQMYIFFITKLAEENLKCYITDDLCCHILFSLVNTASSEAGDAGIELRKVENCAWTVKTATAALLKKS